MIKNCLILVVILVSQIEASPKRGACSQGGKSPDLQGSWYYTWYINEANMPGEFVPMIPHGHEANQWHYEKIMALKRTKKITTLLGFNEPERKDQGNTTVDEAILAWPLLMNTGLRLGSPAVSADDKGFGWLDDFITKAEILHYRVDFIAIHWYGDVSDPNAAQKLVDWLEWIHNRYKRPIWLTEFAGVNWAFCQHRVTMETNLKFLSEIIPLFEKIDYLERYAWFSSNDESSLFDEKSLTPLGEIIARYPLSSLGGARK